MFDVPLFTSIIAAETIINREDPIWTRLESLKYYGVLVQTGGSIARWLAKEYRRHARYNTLINFYPQNLQKEIKRKLETTYRFRNGINI